VSDDNGPMSFPNFGPRNLRSVRRFEALLKSDGENVLNPHKATAYCLITLKLHAIVQYGSLKAADRLRSKYVQFVQSVIVDLTGSRAGSSMRLVRMKPQGPGP